MTGGSRSLRLLIVAHVASGLLVTTAIIARYGADGVGPAPQFLVLAAALVAVYAVPLPVPRGEQLEDVELEEPFLVAILVVLPPAGVLAAALTAAVAGNLRRRREPVKIAFNLGKTATAVGLARPRWRLWSSLRTKSLPCTQRSALLTGDPLRRWLPRAWVSGRSSVSAVFPSDWLSGSQVGLPGGLR